MKKAVLVALADGFEEIEAVTPIDILRRAGLEVLVAGVGKTELTGSNGIRLRADLELEKYAGPLPDAIVLPGGAQGASNLAASKAVSALLERMRGEGRLIAAICAAPAVVLGRTGLLDGKTATCYPGYEKNFGPSVSFSQERVVTDGRVITSRGPGSAMEFALEIVRELVDPATAERLTRALVARPS